MKIYADMAFKEKYTTPEDRRLRLEFFKTDSEKMLYDWSVLDGKHFLQKNCKAAGILSLVPSENTGFHTRTDSFV